MICVNDILIIIGSVLKELIELRQTSGDLWNFCSVFLGTGSLLVWIGMLRCRG
jgi:mucolipin 3